MTRLSHFQSHKKILDSFRRPLTPHTLRLFMNTSFSCFTRIPRLYCKVLPVRYRLIRPSTRPNTRALSQTVKMATAASSLSDKLKSLDLKEPLPNYPNCFPEVNPVDVYRAHLTSILTEVTGVDASIVYPALQWTQTLDKGDLVLPIQALRVKGKKPPELAAEWIEKVGFGGLS